MPPIAVSTGMLELTICLIWTGAIIFVNKDAVVNFWAVWLEVGEAYYWMRSALSLREMEQYY